MRARADRTFALGRERSRIAKRTGEPEPNKVMPAPAAFSSRYRMSQKQ